MHLFVYGTLLSAIPSSMSKFLGRKAELIGPATTPGTLYDLGMYPGFRAGGTGTVHGELYRLNEATAAMTWEMLDAYESVTGAAEDEYERVGVPVTTAEGITLEADTYVYRKPLGDKPVIPDGDYVTFFAENALHQRFANGG